jgi:hypothetical protein
MFIPIIILAVLLLMCLYFLKRNNHVCRVCEKLIDKGINLNLGASKNYYKMVFLMPFTFKAESFVRKLRNRGLI